MQEVSKLDQCAERLNKKEIKSIFPDTYLNISDATKLKGEFALCTKSLFLHLDILMKENNIKFIDDQASQVNLSAQNIIEIDFNDQKKSIKSQKLIVAAGPSSANLFNKNFKIIPMLQGVGSAIILNDLRTLPKSFSKYVIQLLTEVAPNVAYTPYHEQMKLFI